MLKMLQEVLVFGGVVFSLLVSGQAMASKSFFEQTFLTEEQKIKLRNLNLLFLSILLGSFASYIGFVWQFSVKGQSFNQIHWEPLGVWWVFWFLCSLVFLYPLLRLIDSFFIKFHYKYKIELETIGPVYIVKMLNPETCICSKDPNVKFSEENEEFYLVKMEALTQQKLLKEKIQKPKRSVWKRIIE